MSRANFTNKTCTKGFSLVEVMVGLTLGLLTVAVIVQVFSVFENQKRITSAGSDAQENGLMALVQIEQAVRNSGAGLVDQAIFSCTNLYSYYESGGTVTIPAPDVPVLAGHPLAPVVITDGGTAGSDTISLMRGTDFLGSIPVTLTDSMPQPSAELNVSRTAGFTNGQLILLLEGNHCTVMQVTQVQDAALKIQHNPGNDPTHNPSGSFYSGCGSPWPCYTTGAKIVPFGSFVIGIYSVDGNYNLQVANGSGPSATTTALNKDIVSLQAQYGVSSAVGVQNVSAWVDATAGSEWAPANLDTAHVKRIKAIRVTVVARSGKKEAASVTASAPGGVDISGVPDWQNYRYRVYTTIIPLRNIIWANL